MANRLKYSPRRAERFLDALRSGQSVTAAAAAVGVSRRTTYDWRAERPDFAREWEAAVEEGTDRLEDEAWRRAVDGVEEPLVSAGKLVTTTRRFSDTLLVTLLKSRRPERYRERIENTHSGPGGGPIQSQTETRVVIVPAKETAQVATRPIERSEDAG